MACSWTPRPVLFFISAVTATLALLPLPALAADQDVPLALLKQFVEEFVDIRPGQDKFPAALPAQQASESTSENTATPVRLPAAFAMGRYEVPQNLYEAVMGHNPSRWKGPRNSVEMISWDDARQFCEKLTVILRSHQLIAADEVIRLPTEAEWEYCCRAGTTTKYSFGDEIRRAVDPAGRNSILDEHAWYTGNAAGNDPPVGALKPNPWGLYDMHGYLWEWTASPWTAAGAAQATAEATPQVVLRGGSWKDPAERLTSAFRRPAMTTLKDDAVGFRCVKSRGE